jgi:hypothetical protein
MLADVSDLPVTVLYTAEIDPELQGNIPMTLTVTQGRVKSGKILANYANLQPIVSATLDGEFYANVYTYPGDPQTLGRSNISNMILHTITAGVDDFRMINFDRIWRTGPDARHSTVTIDGTLCQSNDEFPGAWSYFVSAGSTLEATVEVTAGLAANVDFAWNPWNRKQPFVKIDQ